MPLYRNKFQPYFPDTDSPNNEQCGPDYCHPISTGDMVMTQFYQTPCGANEINDPSFDNQSLSAELLTDTAFPSPSPTWTSAPGGAWTPSGGVNSIAVYDASFVANSYTQAGVAITPGNIYRFLITVGGLQGGDYVNVYLGSATPTLVIDTIGSGQEYYIQAGNDNTDIVFEAVSTNNIHIDNVSLKEVTYTDWDTNGAWVLFGGLACHIEGVSSGLVETVSDYLLTGEYYSIQGMVTGYVAGSCGVYLATTLVGTISSNGEFHYYGTATVDGVVSFNPSADFIGCISFPQTDERWWGVRALRNDYIMYLVDENGDETDISYALEYYNEYITLFLEATEDLIGCYYLTITDTCTITGDNLVTDGDFANGNYDNWQRTSGSWHYDIIANEMVFIFEPMDGYSNMILNGDFATGDFTSWTAGAGWSVVGNKARHAPGSTATLVQAVNIGTYNAFTQNYWLQLVISNWTVGTISVQFGSSPARLFGANDVMTARYLPGASGVNNLTITPSSNFDGDLDDFNLIVNTVAWTGSGLNNIPTNPLIVAGNYQLSFEITATDDPRIGIAMRLNGQTQPVVLYGAIGVHTFNITDYVPGGQNISLYNSGGSGDNTYLGRVTIDNISLVRIEPFEATYTSECLNFRNLHEGTRIIQGSCDTNNLGFEFENTGFFLSQRVECRSLNPTYPGEILIQKSGSGSARVTYGDLEKYYLFATGFISETAHDAMAAMIRCDHLLIGTGMSNGTEYVALPEEYNPQWRAEGDYSLSTVNWYIRVKTAGQVFNRHR